MSIDGIVARGKPTDYECPKEHPTVRCEGMFHWRGRDFTGLVCATCGAMWDDPEDSFWKHVTGEDAKEPLKVRTGT